MAPLPALAELDDLSTRLGIALDPGSPDGSRAQALLDDASALIRAECEIPDPTPDVIVAICLAVAYRAYKNPDATSQASVGDVSVSYSGTGSGTAVYLTRIERTAIRKASGVSSAGSIEMSTDTLSDRDLLWAPTPGGELLPLGPVPWEE